MIRKVVFFDGVAEPVLKLGCSYGVVTAVILRDADRRWQMGLQTDDGCEMSEDEIADSARELVLEYLKFLRSGGDKLELLGKKE